MPIDGYDSEELKSFYRVLEAAIAEANARSLDLPIYEMTNRLFAAADRGERDPASLKNAVLDGSRESPVSDFDPPPAAVLQVPRAGRRHREARAPRQVLTLFPNAQAPAKGT